MKQLLLRVQNGEHRFVPHSETEDAMEEFQPIAKCLKTALDEGLVEHASFPTSKRRGAYGHTIAVVVTGGLTQKGQQWVDSSNTKPPSALRSWLAAHAAQFVVAVAATVAGAIIIIQWGIK